MERRLLFHKSPILFNIIVYMILFFLFHARKDISS
nr:MAG TPA: hypothetical protein [Caudoviricetes sp.]